MANYLLIYTGGSGAPATPEAQAAVLKQWNDWFGSLGGATVDGGNPCGPVAKHVSQGGVVAEGPVGAMATGYSILKADSLEAAVEMAKGCPVLESNGQVTVYETYNAM
jgi:hypothetical protein